MKKLASITFSLFLFLNAYSAGNNLWGWFHFTPKAGAGSSLLVNATMFNQDNAAPRIFNFSYLYGAQLGMAFLDHFDFSFEISQQSISQLYWLNIDNLRYTKNLNLVSNDKGGFFKLMGNTGYFEIGAMVSELKRIEVENNITENTSANEINFNDDTDYFNTKHVQLAVGFGASLVQVDILEVTLGVRVKYGLQPLSNGPNLPLLDNVYPQNLLNSPDKSSDLSFMLELNVHNFFGFFGKAICGNQAVVFFQKPKNLW